MLEGIVLDALLVLILLMMIPLGFLRGGLREVCTSAGLLLGVLLAQQWTARLAEFLTGRIDMRAGLAQFVVAIVIVVVSTAVIGYGGSSAFSYRPGPGGRMYGAYLALVNGLIFIGFLVNAIIDAFYDGVLPDAIDGAYVSRALSVGFEWVLLVAALGVLGATIFGMFVRERSDEEFDYDPRAYTSAPSVSSQQTQRHTVVQPSVPETDVVTPEPEEPRSAPMRIREVRHWEDQPKIRPPQSEGYGGGWRQTWPDAQGKSTKLPWEQQPTETAPKRASPRAKPESSDHSRQEKPAQREVLRDWLKEDPSSDT